MNIEGSIHRDLYLCYTLPVKGRLHICSSSGADIHMLSNEFDVSFYPNFGKYDNNPMSGYGHNSSSLIDSV